MTNIDWKSLNILVVDDDMAQRRLQVFVLNQLGVTKVRMAENGLLALVELSSEPTPFDLVISDLDMPTMTGFEFVKRLRTNADVINPDVPVLIITSNKARETVQKSIDLGVQGFITKPINEAKLRLAITRALSQ